MTPDIVTRLPDSMWCVAARQKGLWMILGIEYDAKSAMALKRQKKAEGFDPCILRYPIEGKKPHQNNGGGVR